MERMKSLGLVVALVIGLVLGGFVSGYAETDVTSKVQVIKSALSYDRLKKQSYLNVSVKNISNDVLLAPVKVVIDSVSPSTVTVANADGATAEGKPYLSFATTTGQLLAGATIAAKRLAFSNPTAAKFTYSARVLSTIPEISGAIGVSGGSVTVPDKTNPTTAAVTVEFPEGALTAPGTVTIDTTIPVPAPLPATTVGPVIDIRPGGSFAQPVTIKFSYNDSQLAQSNIVDEASLRVYTFDPASSLWQPLDESAVDVEHKTVIGKTNHFSVFCVLGNTLVGPDLLTSNIYNPVVFVHGIDAFGFNFKNSFVGNSELTFGKATQSLSGEGLNVFNFNYDTKVDIKLTAASFSAAVKKIVELTGSTQVNVIAHSMGGLVARTYLQGLAEKEVAAIDILSQNHGSTPPISIPRDRIPEPYKGEIGKFLMLGTPNHGSFFSLAAQVLQSGIPSFNINYLLEFQKTVAAKQMWPGSDFLNALNSAPFPIPVGYSPVNLIAEIVYGNVYNKNTDGVVTVESVQVSPEHAKENFRYYKEHELLNYSHSRLSIGNVIPGVWADKGIAEATEPVEDHEGYRIMKSFALDADNDGVPDNFDNCPNTSLYSAVGSNGCPASEAPSASTLDSPLNNQQNIAPIGTILKWYPAPDAHNYSTNPIRYCITVKEDGATNATIPGCDQGIFTPANETKLLKIEDGDVLRLPQEVMLKEGTKYWWAVWAVDSDGNWGPASEWWSFTTDKDSDGDDVYDSHDLCADTNIFETADANGCSQSQLNKTWFEDKDGDGFGNPNASKQVPTKPDGYVANNTDCDDTNPAKHPNATDICGDGVDQDCSGSDETCSIPPSGTTYTEDFSGTNLDSYQIVVNDTRMTPTWRIENGKLTQDAGNDHNFLLIKDMQHDNQVISTDVSTHDTGGYGGVVFWYHDADNWASVYLYPADQQTISVHSSVNGTIAQKRYPFTCANNTVYRLQVLADSDAGKVTVFVNGSQQFEHTITATYKSGLTGLNSGNAGATFDNFSISPLLAQTSNSLGMTFNEIPAGTFTMGSPDNEAGRTTDEGPQHQVTISKPFYIQTTEVTQGQWRAVMGNNPSWFATCGDTCPVTTVSMEDVQLFIAKMNQRGEGTYRLPTEAEWEYAARAGSTTAFVNGGITASNPDSDPDLNIYGGYTPTASDNDPNLNVMGWYIFNSGNMTHAVAQKQPNFWGLYDMHGNVWEMVQDYWGSYTSAPVTDPQGPTTASQHNAVRGGSWARGAALARSASRALNYALNRSNDIGFRLVYSPVNSSGLSFSTNLNDIADWTVYGSASKANQSLIIGDYIGYENTPDADGDGNIPANLFSLQNQMDSDIAMSVKEFDPPLILTWRGCLPSTALSYHGLLFVKKNPLFTGEPLSAQHPSIEDTMLGFWTHWENQNEYVMFARDNGTDQNTSIPAAPTADGYCGEFKIKWINELAEFYLNGQKLSEQHVSYFGPAALKIMSFDKPFIIESMTVESSGVK